MRIGKRLTYEANRLVLKANYWLGRYQETIWLIGDGRSGTTWVSSLINWDHQLREMFEPFHPRAGREMQAFLPHHYLRPNEENDTIYRLAKDVFSGHLTQRRVDAHNSGLVYRGLLVKDIFVNLAARWAVTRFPNVKIVLLVRNPFAAALSKHKKRHWLWVTDPKDLQAQPALQEDYLHEFDDVINACSDDYIERQILIWSIIHHVPLRQFEAGKICVVFYEDIYAAPMRALSTIFQFVRGTDPTVDSETLKRIIATPSRVAGAKSNLAKGQSPVNSWQNELSTQQIDRGYAILARFGLDTLYDANGMPQEGQVERLLARNSAPVRASSRA